MKCSTPHTFRRDGKNVTVPCRKCMPCRVNHAQEWSFRIKSELRYSKTAHFITLTYSDEQIPRNDSGNTILVKSDLQKFFKRLRFQITTWENTHMANNGVPHGRMMRFPSVKYYACGEYGEETFRAHFHAIVFNIPQDVLQKINKIWKHGHVKVGTVTPASISYVTKYITKVDSRDLELRDLTQPFNLMSKGLGSSYVNPATTEYHSHLKTMKHVRKDKTIRLPDYYDSKLHNLEDWETKLKFKHSKAIASAQMARIQRDKDKELRKLGINPAEAEHEANKLRDAKLNRKKRNKL